MNGGLSLVIALLLISGCTICHIDSKTENIETLLPDVQKRVTRFTATGRMSPTTGLMPEMISDLGPLFPDCLCILS